MVDPMADPKAIEKIDLSTYLDQFRGESLLYRPCPGDGGDALTAAATLQLFDRCGLDVELWSENAIPEGRTIFFGGGGNLTPAYREAATFIETYHRNAKKLIVLPQTIDGHEDLLRGLGPNVDVICREPLSFEHVRKVRGEQDLYLADDLALSLDVRAVLNEGFPDLQGHPRQGKYQRRQARLNRRLFALRRYSEIRSLFSRHGMKTLSCLRGDVEKTLEPTLLLGKQVLLYRNSYWKNRAVNFSSLAGQFEHVSWVS
jgi:hypothetical protein